MLIVVERVVNIVLRKALVSDVALYSIARIFGAMAWQPRVFMRMRELYFLKWTKQGLLLIALNMIDA